MSRWPVICLAASLLLPSAASAQICTGAPLAVQILGSGGPQIKAERASASYLVWVDDKAKVLIDMGGGAFFRFGQAQAKFTDLAMMGVSHLHPDHISDLPALLWGGRQIRKEALPIVGPSGNDVAPAFPDFLTRLFDQKNGAFQVLGSTVATGPDFHLDVSVADVTKPEPTKVFDRDGLVVTAFGIPHANLPTLAYRIEVGGVSAVLSSDQNGTNPRFVDFARGANVLVMHMAIAAGATSPLHAAPAVVGRIAQDAGVGRLIVSHIGQFDLNAAIADVKKAYTGRLTIGADLQCTHIRKES
jgi:ribonuclease BN (tRNA processing enzyme)